MKRIVLIVVAVAVGLILSACTGGRDALTIYSGRDEALIGPLLDRFVEESGIDIDVRYGDSGDLALLLAEEGDDTPADIFFSQSPGAVEFLATQDLLGEIDQDTVALVGERYRSDDAAWVGITARRRVLVYNSELVDPTTLPDSVLDLTDDKYRGRVAMAPPNASFQDFITAMRQLLGNDTAQSWLEGMAANDTATYPDNNSIVDAVARGEIPMGLVNHYYNYRYLHEDPSAESRNYIFPDGDIGALVIESSVAILAPTDRTSEARRFVRFLLDRSSQRYFADNTFEYPLVEGVDPAGDLPSLDEAPVPPVDIEELGDLKTTVDMIRDSGLL